MRAQPEAVFRHDVILITINRSAQKKISMYDAVRSAWKLDPKRAEKQAYVLAVERGVIVGAFEAVTWRPADPRHFPQMHKEEPGRWGFDGHAAPKEIWDLYEGGACRMSLGRPGQPIRSAM